MGKLHMAPAHLIIILNIHAILKVYGIFNDYIKYTCINVYFLTIILLFAINDV